MKKRIIAFALAAMMVLGLTACGGEGGADDKLTIKVGTVMSENAPAAAALEQMKAELAEKSEGRINMMIYYGGQLGGEPEMVEQARSGDIQMATSNHMNISNTIHPLAALESYFLFEDYDHAFRFQDSEAGQAMLDAYNEMGLQGIAYLTGGFRHFTNSKRPITCADDLKGIKIRGYSEVQIAAWEAVGVNLSSVAWNELFTALQQKLIDGAEYAISSMFEQKFYEVQKYITLTSHLLSSDILICNQAWLENLPEADRTMIMDAARNAVEFHRENFVALENEYLETFEQYGNEINELEPEKRQEIADKINEAVNPTIIKLTGQETFDMVQEWAEKTKA